VLSPVSALLLFTLTLNVLLRSVFHQLFLAFAHVRFFAFHQLWLATPEALYLQSAARTFSTTPLRHTCAALI
jgi:hypothetical protein